MNNDGIFFIKFNFYCHPEWNEGYKWLLYSSLRSEWQFFLAI